MASIQWRPEVNALTVPQSYKIRCVHRDSFGTEDQAAAMTAENPNYSVEDNKTMLANLVRVLQRNLISGSLNITVSRFADLVKMIRSGYSGRVVDVLVVKTGV